jgi:hypothetical protein
VARELEFGLRSSWRSPLRGLAVACWLATSGCADSKPELSGPRTWVGTVERSDVIVGIAASGRAATLFFCGGARSYVTRTHWFKTENFSSSDFSVQDGEFRVSGVIRDDQIEGTVEFGEAEPLSFSAGRPGPDTLAGVYDAIGPCGHAGLIVFQSAADAESYAQGACVLRDGDAVVIEQVNPVLPIALDADRGVLVELGLPPSERFLVHPLTP